MSEENSMAEVPITVNDSGILEENGGVKVAGDVAGGGPGEGVNFNKVYEEIFECDQAREEKIVANDKNEEVVELQRIIATLEQKVIVLLLAKSKLEDVNKENAVKFENVKRENALKLEKARGLIDGLKEKLEKSKEEVKTEKEEYVGLKQLFDSVQDENKELKKKNSFEVEDLKGQLERVVEELQSIKDKLKYEEGLKQMLETKVVDLEGNLKNVQDEAAVVEAKNGSLESLSLIHI